MKKTMMVFVPIFLCFVLFTCSLDSAIDTSESIAEKVFRLHIIANSDTQIDQNVKLLVRDELLKAADSWYQNCHTAEEAVAVSRLHLSEAQSIAQRVLNTHHFHYHAAVNVDKEFFDTRQYEHFTLPSGIYQCLKIVLGKGEGHNWWCVMFPSVCLPSCSDGFDGVLSDEEQAFINDDYLIKFKIVELYEKYIQQNKTTTGQ